MNILYHTLNIRIDAKSLKNWSRRKEFAKEEYPTLTDFESFILKIHDNEITK